MENCALLVRCVLIIYAVLGGLGLGLVENVIEAYNYLAINYAAGDEIILFGFSRRAYTARALAGLISSAGIIDTGSLEWSHDLYQAYRRGTEELDKFQTKNQFKYKINDAKIRVIGCWDTVGSLGIPKTLHVVDRLEMIKLRVNYRELKP